MNTFAERLKSAIENKGLSKYKISKDTKITEATLSNYCNDENTRNYNASIVNQLARYLDVDSEWLLSGTGKKPDFVHTVAKKVSDRELQYFPNKTKVDIPEDISLIIASYEKQLEIKDEQINRLEERITHLMGIIENKLCR